MDGRTEIHEAKPPRFPLVHFADIRLTTDRNYAIKGLLPRQGLAVIWGPPKCGKSFFALDAVIHVALGRDYQGRRVQSGPVVYIAAEGEHGFGARVEAFKQHRMAEDADMKSVPFYLLPLRVDLIRDHEHLIEDINTQADGEKPSVVVLDTLNRTFNGSESSDEDMTKYIEAADAIREWFKCCVVIVHHCGVEGTRPRGHTSLSGAVDAQIAVSKNTTGATATVELMKDGPEGDVLGFQLESVVVGLDPDGDPITSCIVSPVNMAETEAIVETRLTRNQSTMLDVLRDAGTDGLSMEDWNARARDAGLGAKRKADLYDFRKALKDKSLIYQNATTYNWQLMHR